jgi:hypothetical protein
MNKNAKMTNKYNTYISKLLIKSLNQKNIRYVPTSGGIPEPFIDKNIYRSLKRIPINTMGNETINEYYKREKKTLIDHYKSYLNQEMTEKLRVVACIWTHSKFIRDSRDGNSIIPTRDQISNEIKKIQNKYGETLIDYYHRVYDILQLKIEENNSQSTTSSPSPSPSPSNERKDYDYNNDYHQVSASWTKHMDDLESGKIELYKGFRG